MPSAEQPQWPDELAQAVTQRFADVHAPRGFEEAVLERVRRQTLVVRPSMIPEMLDFVGWAAVLALVANLVHRLFPFRLPI